MGASAKPLLLNYNNRRKELLQGSSAMSENPNQIAGNSVLHSPRSMPSAPPLPDLDLQEAILSSTDHLQKSLSMDHGLRHDLRVQKLLARASSEAENRSNHDLRRDSIGEEDIHGVDDAPGAELEQETVPRPRSLQRSRSKTETGNAKQATRHKSPYGRLNSSDVAMDTESPSGYNTRRSRRSEAATAAALAAVEADRGRSPRKCRVSSSEIAAAVPDVAEEVPAARKSRRSSSRRSRVAEQPQAPDTDLDVHRATRQGHVRVPIRQHRRKASEPAPVSQAVHPSLLEHPFTDEVPPMQQHHYPVVQHQQYQPAPPAQPQQYQIPYHPPSGQSHQYQSPTVPPSQIHAAPYSFRVASTSSSPSSSRRASREFRSLQSSDWLQYIEDIVMWRHIPRSALVFGAGCFFIMSASVIQDMHYSVISVMAYIAFFYLGAIYIKRSFLRSNTTPVSMPGIYMITEAEALRLVRIILPPINIILHKLGDLFCGEPVVTLKVAAALWLLAKAGTMMNAWTITRIAYFAIFTVPKCYSSYTDQMHMQARNALRIAQNLWATCSHKKAVLCAALALAWNLSSVSTRVCGAFMALVALRAYQHVIRQELQIDSNFLNPNRTPGVTYATAPNSFQIAAGGYQLGIQQHRM